MNDSNDVGEPSDPNTAGGEGGGALPIDTIFDVLQDSRRRYLLHYLSDRSEGASIREIARRIAEWETRAAEASGTVENEGEEMAGEEMADENGEVDGVDDDHLERVIVSLHHTHLPKLSETGIVAHDEGTDRVSTTGLAAATDPYLEFAVEYERLGE